MMMVHIFISNIFLLNYLVAIISSVYSIMIIQGEFSYKSNKYEFIEKYSVPLMDRWGYSELVIHPPPLNIFTIVLAPFTIRKHNMKKAANIFSKCIFWIENVAYIILMMFYFLFMVPLNYFIVLGNIFKLATGCRRIGLFFFWILFGTLVMIF